MHMVIQVVISRFLNAQSITLDLLKREKILKVFVMFVSMLKDGMVLEKQRQKQSNGSSFKMSENNCKNTE